MSDLRTQERLAEVLSVLERGRVDAEQAVARTWATQPSTAPDRRYLEGLGDGYNRAIRLIERVFEIKAAPR